MHKSEIPAPHPPHHNLDFDHAAMALKGPVWRPTAERLLAWEVSHSDVAEFEQVSLVSRTTGGSQRLTCTGRSAVGLRAIEDKVRNVCLLNGLDPDHAFRPVLPDDIQTSRMRFDGTIHDGFVLRWKPMAVSLYSHGSLRVFVVSLENELDSLELSQARGIFAPTRD